MSRIIRHTLMIIMVFVLLCSKLQIKLHAFTRRFLTEKIRNIRAKAKAKFSGDAAFTSRLSAQQLKINMSPYKLFVLIGAMIALLAHFVVYGTPLKRFSGSEVGPTLTVPRKGDRHPTTLHLASDWI